jgi:hypothetical protein
VTDGTSGCDGRVESKKSERHLAAAWLLAAPGRFLLGFRSQGREVTLRRLAGLAPADWCAHLPTFDRAYPGWRFATKDGRRECHAEAEHRCFHGRPPGDTVLARGPPRKPLPTSLARSRRDSVATRSAPAWLCSNQVRGEFLHLRTRSPGWHILSRRRVLCVAVPSSHGATQSSSGAGSSPTYMRTRGLSGSGSGDGSKLLL